MNEYCAEDSIWIRKTAEEIKEDFERAINSLFEVPKLMTIHNPDKSDEDFNKATDSTYPLLGDIEKIARSEFHLFVKAEKGAIPGTVIISLLENIHGKDTAPEYPCIIERCDLFRKRCELLQPAGVYFFLENFPKYRKKKSIFHRIIQFAKGYLK